MSTETTTPAANNNTTPPVAAATTPPTGGQVTYVDVAGLMGILKNYLVSSPLITNAHGDQIDTSTELQTINQNLNQISNALSANTSGSVLAQQNGVDSIVSDEMNRLQEKKQIIDSALTTQQRMMQINDSYTKRQRQYVKMLVAISVGIVIMIFLSYITYTFPEWNSLASILYVVIIVAVFIYCFWTYYFMLQRDPIIYDKLNIQQAPFPIPVNNGVGAMHGNGMLDGSGNMCTGQSCCNSPGVVWDSSHNICVKEGFGVAYEPFSANEEKDYKLLRVV
jgi:ElaB/YqjD/DUF883 family membrane-anchored ribosome-binding protein